MSNSTLNNPIPGTVYTTINGVTVGISPSDIVNGILSIQASTVQSLVNTSSGSLPEIKALDNLAIAAAVALDGTSLFVDGHDQALEPGMAVTAEIKTGRRRVISYLLSPLQRYAHESGRER